MTGIKKFINRTDWHAVLKTVLKVLAFVLTFAVLLAATLYATVKIICGSSTAAKTTFITTMLETGQLKFVAKIALSDEEIDEIVNRNSMKQIDDADVDEDLISVGDFSGGSTVIGGNENDIEIVDISGLTYKATLMIVKNPARVSLATIVNGDGTWPSQGRTLEEIATETNALGAINGGLYHSTNNSGGYPYGVCVSNGKILRNRPTEYPGLVLIGLTDSNILQIIPLGNMSPAECEAMLKEKGIRDAVCFQEDATANNNHFVQIVINGKARDMNGSGSGLNPRTAIGQRADGALLLLVTDGRGYNSHVGASAADLTEIMMRYGAVNAANLDGGSSTCMYYKGEYLQNSVTFYYSQSSWKLPCAFIVE